MLADECAELLIVAFSCFLCPCRILQQGHCPISCTVVDVLMKLGQMLAAMATHTAKRRLAYSLNLLAAQNDFEVKLLS
jgi:hypothetical protein